MKTILIALALITLLVAPTTQATEPNPANTLVWCGLDYSLVKMIGTADFRQPEMIFPGMLQEWNGLFMKEMLPKLEGVAKGMATDLKAVNDRNEKASSKQIIREDGTKAEMVDVSHIMPDDIAKAVGSYDLKNTQGVGLVFIIDRLVKAQATECIYVVFFDVSSRKVLSSARVVEKGGGYGFRNFWFSPIKEAVGKLPKMYKAAVKTRAK